MKSNPANNGNLIYSSPVDPKLRGIKFINILSIVFYLATILLCFIVIIESTIEYIHKQQIIFSTQNLPQIILITIFVAFIIFLIVYWELLPTINKYFALSPLIIKKDMFMPASPIYLNNKHNNIKYQKISQWIDYSDVKKIIIIHERIGIKSSSSIHSDFINMSTSEVSSLLNPNETVDGIITFDIIKEDEKISQKKINILHYDINSDKRISKIIIFFTRKKRISDISLFFSNPIFHDPDLDFVIITKDLINDRSLSILFKALKDFWGNRMGIISHN